VKADVLSLPLGKVNGQCFTIDLSNFGAEMFFSLQALLKNRGACVDNPNWQCKGDWVNLVNRSDRFAWRQNRIQDIEIIWKV
jgi:hypothetical protein